MYYNTESKKFEERSWYEKQPWSIIIYISVFVLAIFLYGLYTELNRSDSFEYGYNWAVSQEVKSFEECEKRFGQATLSESGCSQYIKDRLNY